MVNLFSLSCVIVFTGKLWRIGERGCYREMAVFCALPLGPHEISDIAFVLGAWFGLCEDVGGVFRAVQMDELDDLELNLFYEISQASEEVTNFVVMS